ncbi:acetyltransferase [Chitinimonas arctica]|uniref:Acetyltransferase n=1 Tax=Chitinimonas arctica TaxID=2594795 RepID=A0A516SC46_9NEIS|nr:acetyltransferase [Chitinimonas arctica]QDQ25716.1 acetyltransferase [Chitinimonas arctica]
MHTDSLLIVGGGGHAKVVMDVAKLQADSHRYSLRLADDNLALAGTRLMGLAIIAPIALALAKGGRFHVAIGNNQARAQLNGLCQEAGMESHSLVHPRAIVANSAKVGGGSFVAAGAILAPDADIGLACIINHGAVVDHDCRIGAFSHIAPNATLAGGVTLGERVLIGAGANVLPGVKIGDGCIVGAGAVVLNDLIAGRTYVGTPARCVREN